MISMHFMIYVLLSLASVRKNFLAQAVTISYIKFMYRKYRYEIQYLRNMLCEYAFNEDSSAVCDMSNEIFPKSPELNLLDIELMYMAVREKKPSNILEIGSWCGVTSRVISYALLNNINEGYNGHLYVIYPVQNKENSALLRSQAYINGNMSNTFLVVHGQAEIKAAFSSAALGEGPTKAVTSLQGNARDAIRWLVEKNSIQFNFVSFSLHNLQRVFYDWIIGYLLEPIIINQSLGSVPFQLHFKLITNDTGMTGHLSATDTDTDRGHPDSGADSRGSKVLLKWLHGQVHRSFELEVFTRKRVKTVNKNAPDSSCSRMGCLNPSESPEKNESEKEHLEPKHEMFAYSTIHPPRIVLLTPCSRPQNLPRVFSTIHFSHVVEWVIVYNYSPDGKPNSNRLMFPDHPKITELFNTDLDSAWGNMQRNVGLKYIYEHHHEEGWLYFLDDDNLLHPNLWTISLLYPSNMILFMGQQVPYGVINFSSKCKVGHVDTGIALLPLALVKNASIEWDHHKNEADGIFMQALCDTYPDRIKRIYVVGTFYNGMKGDVRDHDKAIE